MWGNLGFSMHQFISGWYSCSVCSACSWPATTWEQVASQLWITTLKHIRTCIYIYILYLYIYICLKVGLPGDVSATGFSSCFQMPLPLSWFAKSQAPSFEQLLATAQQRAAQRRAAQRAEREQMKGDELMRRGKNCEMFQAKWRHGRPLVIGGSYFKQLHCCRYIIHIYIYYIYYIYIYYIYIIGIHTHIYIYVCVYVFFCG